MSYTIIPLTATANQEFDCTLAGKTARFTLRTTDYGLLADISYNGLPIATGRLCEDRVDLNPDKYRGLAQFLGFVDTQGKTDPQFAGFGTRYLLVYGNQVLTPAPVVTPALVQVGRRSVATTQGSTYVLIPAQPVANQKFSCLLDGLRAQINLASTDYGLFADVTYNGVQIASARMCLDRTDLNPNRYTGLPQFLGFVDLQGHTDPQFAGIGSRYVLIYGTPPPPFVSTIFPNTGMHGYLLQENGGKLLIQGASGGALQLLQTS